jgi:phage-related protein
MDTNTVLGIVIAIIIIAILAKGKSKSKKSAPTIKNSKMFDNKVDLALQYLKTHSLSEYNFVNRMVLGYKEVSSGSGINVQTKIFQIAPKTLNTDAAWLSSAMVHEATHVKQFLEGRPYYGQKAELECNARQVRYLKAIGDSRASYVANADGKHQFGDS